MNGVPEVISQVLKFIQEKKISEHCYEDEPTADDQKGFTPKDLILQLLFDRDNQQFTPFEVAIATGKIQPAKILLENGGIGNESNFEEEDQEDQYEGLDVGGKKMDWALEHRFVFNIIFYSMLLTMHEKSMFY